MENGKYNPVQGREILTQPTSYGANTNPPPQLLPPTALHLTKQFSEFFLFLIFWEIFSPPLSLSQGEKTAIPLGPIRPRRIEPILKCEPRQPKHPLRLPAPLARRRKTASANHIRERLLSRTNDHFLLLSPYSQK